MNTKTTLALALALLIPSVAFGDAAPPALYHLHDGPTGAYCGMTEWISSDLVAVSIQVFASHKEPLVGYDRWWWDGDTLIPPGPVQDVPPTGAVLTYPAVRPFSTNELKWADVTPPVPAEVLLAHPEIVAVQVTCYERGRTDHRSGRLYVVAGYPVNEQEVRAALGRPPGNTTFDFDLGRSIHELQEDPRALRRGDRPEPTGSVSHEVGP